LKIILFSDLHANPFREFANPASFPGLINSRLEMSVFAIDKILDYARSNKIKHVLFGGDLFHKRNVLQTSLYNVVWQRISKFKEHGIHLVMVPGNHDQTTSDGKVHSLEPMQEIATVAMKACTVDLGGSVLVRCIPYTSDPSQASKDMAIPRSDCSRFLLLAHLAFQGAVTGTMEFKPKEELEAEDIPKGYDSCFFGHYHKRQRIKPHAWYIGSPLQQSRGEAAELDKGFLVYDSVTNEFKNVPLGMPTFKYLTLKDLSDGLTQDLVSNSYVDYEVDKKMDSKSWGKKLLNLGALAVNPVQISRRSEDYRKGIRVKVDPSLDYRTMVKKYIAEYAPESMDAERLANTACGFLEGEE